MDPLINVVGGLSRGTDKVEPRRYEMRVVLSATLSRFCIQSSTGKRRVLGDDLEIKSTFRLQECYRVSGTYEIDWGTGHPGVEDERTMRKT